VSLAAVPERALQSWGVGRHLLGSSEGAGLAVVLYGLIEVAVVSQGGHGLPYLVQVVSSAQGVPHLFKKK